MKNISKYWLLLSLLACVSIAEAQTFLGYSNGTVTRKAGVRFGTGDIQGMAIRIPKENPYHCTYGGRCIGRYPQSW